LISARAACRCGDELDRADAAPAGDLAQSGGVGGEPPHRSL
jgi:hypothetical protein